jgi:hypothetical protein
MQTHLVPNGTAYAIDTDIASVMLLRRDATIEDWSDPKQTNTASKPPRGSA